MKKIICIATLFFLALNSNRVFSWNEDIHRGITVQTQKNNLIDNYLINAGYKDGANTTLELRLVNLYSSDSKEILLNTFERFFDEVGFEMSMSKTALDWLKYGSYFEDTPPNRAVHHFLDPTTGGGWPSL